MGQVTKQRRTGRKPSASTLRAREHAGEIRAMRRAGATESAIAERFECNRDAIRQIVGVDPSPSARARADVKRVRRLYRQGRSMESIGHEYGCSEDTIRRVIGPGVVQAHLAGVEAFPERIARVKAIPTEAFAEAYARLGCAHKVAAELCCHRDTVVSRLDLPRQPAPTVRLSLAEMKRRYENGASLEELAEASGIVRSSVRERLIACGTEMRGRGGANRFPPADELRRHIHAVCLIYQAGATSTLIADEFGIHHVTVQKALAAEDVRLAGNRPSEEEAARFRLMCRAVRRGELVVEFGRLVPRLVSRNQGQGPTTTSTIAREGQNA